MTKQQLFISGYGTEPQKTIQTFQITTENNSLTFKPNWSAVISNASFICPFEDFLFAVSEEDKTCIIYLFKLEDKAYVLKDQVSYPYGAVCHLTYLDQHNLLLASSYENGCLLVIDVKPTSLGPLKQVLQQKPNADGLSRVHGSFPDNTQTFIYVTNIATDDIYTYSIQAGLLVESDIYSLPIKTGPRHLVIGAKNRFLYLITEYSNEIISFKTQNGHLTFIQKLPLIIDAKTHTDSGSSICIDPTSNRIYTALRGANKITEFEISSDNTLTRLREFSSHGDWPRHIALIENNPTINNSVLSHPNHNNSYSILAIANQYSGNVVFLSLSSTNISPLGELPLKDASYVK